MDSREERQKRVDEAFHSSGFGMPYVAPSPLQQEADAAASLVNVKPAAPAPSMWEQVRDSAIGRSYFWGKEDYSRRSREIAERLQISPDMVSVAGEESLKRWEETFRVLDMGERDSEFANTWSDWNDISQTERAIRVHNYADIKQTMGVVDNITSGVRQMDALIQMSALGNERMELEAKGADTEELDAKIQNLQQYIVSQAGNGGIIHETASQLYMMGHQSVHSGKETMIGAFTGAMAGAAGGSVFGGIGALPGAEAGFKTGAYYGYRMGMFNRANEMERGLSYLDYRTGSQYGKLTAEQAAVAATTAGALNATIEFASFGMGMRALSLGARAITGRAAATGAQSIIRNAARAVASAQSVGGAAKLFGKAAGIGVVSETAEEVAQQAVSDIVWNVAADPSTGSRSKPVTEIIGNAVDAGIAAVPAILGMSAVLGAGANVRFVAKAARMLRPDYEIQKELAVHSIGTQMLRDLEADKQTSKLFQKDPALYTRSVQEAADKQGLGAFFVDAHALMETEQGRNILNRMVSGKVVSEEALQTAIETEGRLEVPVGVYLQEDFTEQERGAVDQASAWTKDGATPAEMTAHWENMAASKYAQELQDDIDRMVQAAERVLEEYFPTSNEADKETIRRVLMANPLDLTAARKAVRKELVDYIETEFSVTLREMREDKKDGTVFIATIQESGARGPYSTRRISTNPGWYRDFYKEHKRPPSVNEFYEIMLDWEEDSTIGVAKSEEERSEIQAWVDTGRQALDSLYTIEAFSDTFDELQKENAISLRMHLSADEMKVYDAVKAYMESVGGDAADSAQQAAYLWAKRAKVFAQMMRDMGHADFVATDYLDMHPLFAMDEYTPDAADQMAAQLMQRNGGIPPREYFQNKYGDGGYDGKSMSNRARAAYDLGEKPLSKWTKEEILDAIEEYLDEPDAETAISFEEVKALPAWLLRQEFLVYRSWHHTGALYNATNFYGIDLKALDMPLSYYQQKIEERKQKLADTKEEREKERAEQELLRQQRQERKAWEEHISALRKYTKYKTDKGLLRAVEEGRITVEELERKEQEEQAKGYLKYTDYKTENALIQAFRNGEVDLDSLEALRDKKDPQRIAARKVATAQGKQEWLQIVQGDPQLFRLLAEQARNDRDVALAAIQGGGAGIAKYVGDTLRKDPDFVAEAVRRNIGTLKYFGTELSADDSALLRRVIAKTPRAAGQLRAVFGEQEGIRLIQELAKETPQAAVYFMQKGSVLFKKDVESIFRSSPAVAELVAKDDAGRYQKQAQEFLKAESRIEYYEQGGQELYQAAMYRRKAESLAAFADEVMENAEAVGKAFYRIGAGASFVDVSHSTVRHIQNGDHPLTTGEWKYLEASLNHLDEARIAEEKIQDGARVLGKINAPNKTFGVVLDFMHNGNCFLVTAFTNTDRGINAWMNKKESPSASAKLPCLLGRLFSIDNIAKALREVKGDTETMYSPKEMPLIALHNTDARKIRHIAKMKRIAVPSIGIARADIPYESFGDISLIGDTQLIDPADKENPTHDADAYSPRYPRIYGYRVAKKDAATFAAGMVSLAKRFNETGRYSAHEIEGAVEVGTENSPTGNGLLGVEGVQHAWLADIGKRKSDFADDSAAYYYVRDHRQDLLAWVEERFDEVEKTPLFFDGYTPSGRRRLKEYTLENIVKKLKGKAKNTEGMVYGVGNVRAKHAKQYKKLAAIQADRERIVSPEKAKEVKEELTERYIALTSRYGTEIDNILLHVPPNDWQKALNEAQITDVTAEDLRRFVADVVQAPTEYFEVKKQRAVGLNEFRAAVVPKDTPVDVREILADAGLKVVDYAEGERSQVLWNVAQELQGKYGNILFQRRQNQKRHVRGMTALRDGRQMLFLFRNDANFSTFVHESGHVFLEDLRLMAEQEQAPTWLKTDWETVKEWAGWNDADGADNRAAHEKWARGFEAYVREGKAPSRDLKAVFRRFRRWLVGIYQNLLDLGEVPPESIRNVMDRMLATQDEIDAYTSEQALDSMQSVDEKLAARLATLKAKAAETVEKQVEKKVRQGMEEVLEETIRMWRTARTDELRKEDIYKHEALAKQFGTETLAKYYPDTAAFEHALAEAGGPLEERLQREEQEQRDAFRNELMSPEAVRAQVESYMTGEAGQADLLEAETKYIARERNKLAGEYMKLLRKLDGNPQRGNPERKLHPGELPESPTREELLAKPDVPIVEITVPEDSPLMPSAELQAAQQARDEAYAAGKRGKELPDNPYWKEYRAQVKAWLKEHVPEQVAHPELGVIQIPRKGIDHALSTIKKDAFSVGWMVGAIDTILSKSIIVQRRKNKTGDMDVRSVNILYAPIRLNGQVVFARSVVKERHDGMFYYDLQSVNKNDTEGWLKPAVGQSSAASDTEHLGVSTISVEEMLQHVKSEDQPQPDGHQTEEERLREVLSYLKSELQGHEGAQDAVQDAQKQLATIRQDARKADKELEREQERVAQLRESRAEDAQIHAQKLADMRAKMADRRKQDAEKMQSIRKSLRAEIQARLQGLRDVRDSTQGRLRQIEERAAQTLRQAPIGESLTWKTYQRKIAYYGTLSAKALVRGDYPKAAEMKERQLYHAYLAKHAVMQERQVDKDIRRLRENLKRITRSQQPVRLDTQSRYFVHHLMYQLGLTGTDAQLPTDGFTWSAIEALLNPDVAFGMGGEPVISDALRGMFATDARNEKAWRQMPYEEWEQTARILQAVYTAGRRMHDGLAIVRKSGERVSIETAATELSAKLRARYGEDSRDLRQIRNDMTRADRMGELAGELVAQLIKPEVILNRLDGRAVGVKIEDDSFHRFIYDPIARAANRRREMTAEAKRALSRIFERRYSRNELRTMRQKRMYQIGNRRLYTKEEIFTAALNWGAIENRKRVLHTFGVDERTMEGELGRILTGKDWDTVEMIWELLDSYHAERSQIMERETGVPLGRVQAVAFEINGRKFSGGYYPIVYDPQLSQKASDMDVANELAKQMSSNAVFGAGLGATKQRRAVVNRELLLSLDVLPRAVNEAILHISMREAVLDVAHLLDHAALAEPLQKVIGQSQYRMLREWVRDTWREELVRESSAEQFANLLRRNATFSVMAYRTTTALLNICNLDMVYQSLGHRRTWLALLKFIRHPQRIARKVKEKSSFIAEREENLDRDLARDMKVSGKELSYAGAQGVAAKAAEGVYSAKEAVDRFGYYLITKTDLMLSLPTWQAVYEDTVRAEMERGELTAEQIDAEAIAKADEAVRRIWGSGEIQDQSKVQKGRIMKFFTPFYTFFSVVLNAHIEAGYALKDNGNPVPLMSTVLYWLFLQVLRETLLRGGIDALTGRGPDDDDDWLEYFGKEYAKNFVGTATGGIPGVNIAATLTMNTMLGEYYQGRGSQVVALRVFDELQDLAYAVSSDGRDWVDVGRSASRVGNRLVGFSDTLTDGFWTLLRVTCTESDATWDEAVADIIFDRKARKAQ